MKKILILLIFPFCCLGQQVDTSFGNNGSIITDFAKDFDFFGDLIPLSDGKLLLFGDSYVTNNSNQNGFTIIKYNEDGSFDNTFGIKGKVILSFDSYQNGMPTSAILQNDGKILIAGTTANYMRGAITRLLPNGQLDIDFGFNGKMILESKEINKVLLTPDQKIVLLGRTTTNFSVEKLNTDGFYDTTFGNNGIATLDDNNNFEVFTSGEILSDGTIMCAGNSSNPNFNGNNVVLAKCNANGIFDASYGAKRINMPISSFNQNTSIKELKVLPDNTLILLVQGVYMSSKARIYKIDMNGNLIPSFASNGYYEYNTCLGCDPRLQNIQILPNQKFIVTLYVENSSNNYISVNLFNSDGNLNTNFGTIGIPLGSDFIQIAKTKVSNNKLFSAYNKNGLNTDYYINAYLLDNQYLSASSFENNTNNTIIYPNPFTDKLNINLKEIEAQNIKISIYNINGTEIYTKNFSNFENHTTVSIDELNLYSTGIYFLKIQTDNSNKTFKIIKN